MCDAVKWSMKIDEEVLMFFSSRSVEPADKQYYLLARNSALRRRVSAPGFSDAKLKQSFPVDDKVVSSDPVIVAGRWYLDAGTTCNIRRGELATEVGVGNSDTGQSGFKSGVLWFAYMIHM
ncbi:hypothetical protein RvY_08381 [Ramazzottius varieornatus]|uniref:Uncharacterized protein n=1 Tax=Ramazzottius varieornatus TaxID=947166 RepID=A0A1D1VET6_RAMVA|nr:hypothetical protein RvY_08381 [Ramazzottius varieornatus]